jgi:hypothetical protein
VEKRLLSAGAELVEEEGGGGESGGDAKRVRDWNRVLGVDGCDESQLKAEGSSMFAVFIVLSFGVVVVFGLRSQVADAMRRDATNLRRHRWMRRQRPELSNGGIRNSKLDWTIRLAQKFRCMYFDGYATMWYGGIVVFVVSMQVRASWM